MAIRVVQWTTGNVGRESVKAIAANPGLDFIPYNDNEALILTADTADRRTSSITA